MQGLYSPWQHSDGEKHVFVDQHQTSICLYPLGVGKGQLCQFLAIFGNFQSQQQPQDLHITSSRNAPTDVGLFDNKVVSNS